MKHFGRFSLFEFMLLALICTVFLIVNLNPRTTATEWHPFSPGLFIQSFERGWPASYQAGSDIQNSSLLGESDRLTRQAEFLERTPPKIDSHFALFVNIATLITSIGVMHIAFLVYSILRKRKPTGGALRKAG